MTPRQNIAARYRAAGNDTEAEKVLSGEATPGPVRVQLRRTKGWRMPENTVKVDRTTRYGNRHDWRDWLPDARAHSWALPHPEDKKR